MRGTFGSSGASSNAKPPLRNPGSIRTNFELLKRKAAADFEKNFQQKLSLYKQGADLNATADNVSSFTTTGANNT